LLGFGRFLSLRQRAALVDLDGRKAASGDAQRERPILLVTAPDRQRAARLDFFGQSIGQEFADHFVGGAALQVRGKLDTAILALRGGGQEHELGVGEFHRDPPFGSRRPIAPSPPTPRDGDKAGGAGIPERGHATSSSRATLPLCSHRNASPFWIIFLLVSRRMDHGMILALGPARASRRFGYAFGPWLPYITGG
jgi:hypothetical protein